MKYISTILLIAAAILCAKNKSVIAVENPYPECRQVPVDSLLFDGYMAITYQYVDSIGRVEGLINSLRLFKGKKQLIELYIDRSAMLSFCDVLPYIKDHCYLQDINRDHIMEIMISTGLAGGSCCEGGGNLYAVNDSAKLLLEFEPTMRSLEIVDIENDSIPEIITWDGSCSFFRDYYYGSFMQPLVWKWNGNKYCIANKKFAKYLLDKLGPNQIPPIEYLKYPMMMYVSVRDTVYVPSDLFLEMVFSYYFAGKPNEADSLYNLYWPTGIKGKDDYYKDIKSRIENDPNYPLILKSNW